MGNRDQTGYIVSLRDKTGYGFAPGGQASYVSTVSMNTTLPAYSPAGSYTISPELPDSSAAKSWAQSVRNQANGGPILIFIHGFDNTADQLTQKHAILDFALLTKFKGKNYCLVSFDWPTKVYLESQDHAIKAGPLLVSTCLQVLLDAGVPNSQLNILTHSMGALVLQNALVPFSLPGAKSPPSVNNVLMAEADHFQSAFDVNYTPPGPTAAPFVPPDHPTPNEPQWPSDQVVAVLVQRCAQLTVYWSGKDQALKEAPNKDGTERLGRYGLPTDTFTTYLSQCSNVDYTDYYEESYVSLKDHPMGAETHVWPLMSTKGNPHPPDPPKTAEYPCAPDPHFIQDVYEVLTGASTFTERTLVPNSTSNNWTFTTRGKKL